MTRTRTMAALLALAALAGCTGQKATHEPSFTPPPDSVVSSGPLSPGPITAKPSPVVPTPSQADVHPIRWDRVDVGPDDRTIEVYFTTGIEPCYVLDHVDVAYGADTVMITLYQGHAPDNGTSVACIEIAMGVVTTVVLDQPLAGRQIVDGAKPTK